MRSWSILVLVVLTSTSSALAGDEPDSRRTLTGCSGKSIEEYGIRRDVYGTWMARSSWEDLAEGHWLMVEESGVPRWRREHYDRALDVGVPLIPTDGNGNFNELLDEAARGDHDTTYRSLGKALAQYGSKTVFARLWWEFNLHPVQQSPDRFIAAWRRAVPLIREGFRVAASPGQTLEIVWCSNAGAPNPEPFYPGDEFVDVIGSDVYGMTWGGSDPTTKQMLDRITNEPYMLRWLADFADRHDKPACLGEWANTAPRGDKPESMHGRGDCPEYIDAIYDWAATPRRGCRYVCYFNLPDGGVELTLDQTPHSLARLKARAAEKAIGRRVGSAETRLQIR